MKLGRRVSPVFFRKSRADADLGFQGLQATDPVRARLQRSPWLRPVCRHQARQRRDRGRCLADLTLQRHWTVGGTERLLFLVPMESRQAELGPGDFNLILTDGRADLLLVPSGWAALDHLPAAAGALELSHSDRIASYVCRTLSDPYERSKRRTVKWPVALRWK